MADDRQKISALAAQALALARDQLLLKLRFLDGALAQIRPAERAGLGCMGTDGASLFYDPVYVLKCYRQERALLPRLYLHMLLHGVFSHSFQYDKLDPKRWDLAADIAVENVILDLKVETAALERDAEAAEKLKVLRQDIGPLTAERIYRYFSHTPPTDREKKELERLFAKDVHSFWAQGEQLEVTAEQFRKISERIKAELKAFTRAGAGAESLQKNLEEATRDRYDYSQILRRFTVMGENIRVNDEEFDQIYYTYGLAHYGNLPLIEPLEYREETKVREFVIVIDTSASCRGPLVKAFLRKTYSLLKSSENFFSRVNIHIIQCDNQVRSDIKVTGDEEFEAFLRTGRLQGFGATDFRPAFDYVEELVRQGEFEDLKGLIYFTDGYGVYPEKMPDYQVIFAFLDEDENRAPTPSWSIKVVLESEGLMQETGEGA